MNTNKRFHKIRLLIIVGALSALALVAYNNKKTTVNAPDDASAIANADTPAALPPTPSENLTKLNAEKIAELLRQNTLIITAYGDISADLVKDDGEKTKQATVKEDVQLHMGSVFVIDASKGLVVTNNHVVSSKDRLIGKEKTKEGTVQMWANARRFEARFTGKTEKLHIEVLKSDERVDLALLHVKGISGPGGLKLGNSDDLKIGQAIHLMGSPNGEFDGTYSPGVISNLAGKNSNHPLVQHTAPATHGNSGGPIVDDFGRVVAILQGGRDDRDGSNAAIRFGVPVNELKHLIAAPETKK
jgi:S1-C subfamily serine protease